MCLRFRVPGPPQAKARPRAVRSGGRVRMYTPKRTVAYEKQVAKAAQGALAEVGERWPTTAPMKVTIQAIFIRPQSRFRGADQPGRYPKATKPDLDNVLKAILDGLTKASVWVDDNQVVEVASRKLVGRILDRSSRTSEPPHVSVIVEPLADPG